MLELDREQVMAYRIAVHGLHRTGTDLAALDVFDLGVQDSQRDTAAIALAARLDGEVTGQALADDERFTLAWSHRGAPHLHRSAELPKLRPALVPLGEEDAGARTGWQRGDVAGSGLGAAEAILTTARAIHTAVDAEMTKGAASSRVTKLVPEGLTGWCRGCQATHIYEQLMRLATLIGGARLVMGAKPATLAPLDGGPIPTETDRAGASRIIKTYLRLHGPASPAEAAGFVTTTRNTVAALWPDGLTEVRVDGHAAFIPELARPLLESPPEPDPVRLLPPMDPLLQGRDRELLVPDKAHHKEVWKILGNPGVILSGGEIAGTWRSKASGKRLDVTLSPFQTLRKAARATIEGEAELLAQVRGFGSARVTG